MSHKKLLLRSFISREFYKAALLPLLIIEITLLVLYFSMNAHIIGKSVKTLRDDRLSHLRGIVDSQSATISEQLRTFTDLSKVLQWETKRFFDSPGQFVPPAPPAKFDFTASPAEFGFAPNGVYYKLRDNGGCSLYYTDLHPIGPREKEKAMRSEALDPLFKHIYHANKNIVAVYLNTHDSMCRYYPFCENIYEQLIPKMNIPEFNFYYLADAAHNPERGPVWTAAYLDPMGKGWMMSCIVPVYTGDFLEGVAGIDITIGSFIDALLGLQLPWKSQAFLVDAQGTIMAMPREVADVFGLTELKDHRYRGRVRQDTHKPEQFNLLKSVLTEMTEPVSDLMRRASGTVEFSLDNHPYVLCQATVSETGWKLMVLADKQTILAPISRLERHAKQVGYAAAGFMILFYILFFFYLFKNTRRMSGRIAATVGGMSQAIQRLGTGIYKTRMQPSNVVELDELSRNFELMSDDLRIMHDSLKTEVDRANAAKNAAKAAEERLAQHQTHLEKLVASRTHELTDANHRLKEDIIKRKEVERVLDQERLQLLSIFDSIDEPVYVCSPDTYELLYVNEALKKFWPDPIGKKCYEVLQNLKAPCSFCTNKHIFGENTGRAHIWEFHNETQDRWFRCVDKAIKWPDGQMVRYEMAIEITAQKQAARDKERLMNRLQRAEKMEALGTLAGGVAHDLNNILGGLVGYPELLLMDLPENSPLRKSILTIQKSGQKAAAIVQDLLTLARRNVAVMETTHLNYILLGYLSSPEHERLQRYHPSVSFHAKYDDNLLNCMGSAVHLSKMAMNLISNAAEALPEGGEVAISTRNQYLEKPFKGYEEVKEGDYVVLAVTDNGVGIHAEDLDRIFEPFYTKKKMGRSGTGLGMAVVWGTIKDHQGYIEVKSAPGAGTTFEVYLPAHRKSTETMDEADSAASCSACMGNQETILIVDDVKIQRDLAKGMLSKLGYTARAVSSGEEAVEYLKRHRVDLLVLDMIMEPNIDGLETYKRVLKIHPGQKAIIVSGYSETDAIKETQALGAGKYVKKPYSLQELGLAVYQELYGSVE